MPVVLMNRIIAWLPARFVRSHPMVSSWPVLVDTPMRVVQPGAVSRTGATGRVWPRLCYAQAPFRHQL